MPHPISELYLEVLCSRLSGFEVISGDFGFQNPYPMVNMRHKTTCIYSRVAHGNPCQKLLLLRQNPVHGDPPAKSLCRPRGKGQSQPKAGSSDKALPLGKVKAKPS